MQVNFYKNDPVSKKVTRGDRTTVQAPGYVSTNSWNKLTDEQPAENIHQKGRAVTPTAGAMGLHRLTLEAFWLD